MADQDKAGQHGVIAKAWLKWLLLFVPLFAVTMAGMHWLGFGLVMPILLALLMAVLLYQRVINRRTWRSILWGVHASDK